MTLKKWADSLTMIGYFSGVLFLLCMMVSNVLDHIAKEGVRGLLKTILIIVIFLVFVVTAILLEEKL